MKPYLSFIFFLILTLLPQSFSYGGNVMLNPSFENGLANWYTENKGCVVTNETAHTGSYSLHCLKKENETANGFIAQWSKLTPGFFYRFSGYYKMKEMKNDWSLMFYAECGGYGIWDTVKCETIPCVDKWEYNTYKSVMTFNTNGTFQFGIQTRNNKGNNGYGELWVDDISLEAEVLDNILRSCEVLSYKQEVFENEVEVIADCLVAETAFEKGDYLNFTLDVISQTDNKTYITVKEWTFEKRTENYVAVFKLNPKELKEGFYTLRVTMDNTYFNLTETVESNMHKLKEKINYQRYIDEHLRCIDNGKPFFPMGIYTYTSAYDDEEIKALADSKLNLIIGESVMSRKDIDLFYEKSGKKLRVITILNCINKGNTTEDKLECTRKRVEDLKDSPGLFGYYLVDEPGEGSIPIMRAITLLIRELDPHHFVYCAINRRLSLHKFKEGFDVTGFDDYPVQHYDDLRSIIVASRQGRDRLINSRAMWDIPQFFDWSINGYENESSPTEAQLRHMTFQFITGGAMGLIYFNYGDMKLTHEKCPIEVEFGKLKRVMDEIWDTYRPIMFSGEKVNPALQFPKEEDYMCYARFFRKDHYDHILLINAWENRSLRCKLSTSINSKVVKQLTGQTKVDIVEGKIDFNLPALDIVWIQVLDPDYDPPKEESSHTVLIVVLVIVGILVLGIGGAAVYLFILQGKSFAEVKAMFGLGDKSDGLPSKGLMEMNP